MKDFARQVVDALQLQAIEWGDVRIVFRNTENVVVHNGAPEVVRSGESFGFGVRVRKNGAWGFAASSEISTESLAKTVRRAVRIAEASGMVGGRKRRFEKVAPVEDYYATPHQVDPFSVPLAEKLALLTAATKTMQRAKKVKIAKGFYSGFKEKRIYADVRGSSIEQDILQCGAGISATAIKRGEVQTRSYPSSFGGNLSAAGWEFVRELELESAAERTAAEAEELLTAPVCPSGETTVILEGSQLALQVHESIGHPIELDRIFGTEASFAGESFLEPAMLGKFRYGSPLVNVTADATVRGGLGTFGYDDEGVPAQRSPIVTDGVLQNFLSCRSTAPRVRRRSNGTMRADGWQHIPLIRMTNINLEPGEWELDDLIADTDRGLWLDTNKSWSIDDKRINFQFATEVAREIKNGQLGRLYKKPVYTGITPKFWGACDAVCNADHWVLWGIPNCGKGEPCQTARVSHGVAPARFRNVQVEGAGGG